MKRLVLVSLLLLFSAAVTGTSQSAGHLGGEGAGLAGRQLGYYPPVAFTLDFDAGNLRFSSTPVAGVTYDRVTYPGTEPTAEVGKPELPLRRVQLVVPADATVTGVTITEATTQELANSFNIVPAQPPAPCCQPPGPQPPGWVPTRPVAPPDPATYASTAPYPTAPVVLQREGYLGGWHLVGVAVYPLQYVPAQRRLLFHRRIAFQVELAPCQTDQPLLHSRANDTTRDRQPAACPLSPASCHLPPATPFRTR
jgi:hypothetical protein